MANEVKIKLTDEQKAKIKEGTGQDLPEIRVSNVGNNPAMAPTMASARPAAKAALARPAAKAALARPAAKAALARPAAKAALARPAAKGASFRPTARRAY